MGEVVNEVLFFVPGQPVPKKRPRVMKSGVTFTPKESLYYENRVLGAYKQKYPMREPTKDPLRLCVTFSFPIPQSAKRKKLPDKIQPGDQFVHRPDLDNLVKSVLDALNGVAFADDAQVVMIVAQKVYGAIPGATVTITEAIRSSWSSESAEL